MRKPPTETDSALVAASRRGTTALTVLAVCAILTLLYLCHTVFVPVALALLFALVLSSAVEWLYRHRVPRALSAVLMLLILLMAIAGTLNAVAGPAQQWFAGLPQTIRTIERKVRPIQQLMSRVEALTTGAGMGGQPKPAQNAVPPAAAPSALSVNAADILLGAREGLVSTLTVIILTLFLLSGGPPMLARMTASLGADVYAVHVLTVIEAVRSELGRYYGTIALINLGLGTATGLAMWLLGVPNAPLWGTMAALFNFVPYVGSATTLLVLTVVALVTFDSPGRIVAVVAVYLGLATLEGQVVQPLFVGRRLELNPLLVFLAVWFGGWLWGIAGITIAVPSLVALKVAAEHNEHGGPLAEFLSPVRASAERLGRRARNGPQAD